MKKALLLKVSLVLVSSMSLASTEPQPIQGEPQKIEISSAECHSTFGNMFCSGEYTCKQAAIQNAEANHCKLDIKKVEAQRHDDYVSSDIAYRSYSCNVIAQSDCSVASTEPASTATATTAATANADSATK